MSEIVHYKGKLKNKSKNIYGDIETKCMVICTALGFDELEKYYYNWQDQLEDKFSGEYFVKGENVYSVEFDETKDDNEIFIAERKENGEIEFEVKYYNGGCNLSEALDISLDKMKC